jgi:hypothetical protein
MEYIPYTYIVKNKTTGLFYYGVKFSKRDANPKLFWKKYFTSSRIIKQLIEVYGKDDFDYQIRKTFSDATSAVKWEQRVIKRIIKNEKCINMSLGSCGTIYNNVVRTIPDKHGITSYQYAATKTKQTRLKKVHTGGLNDYQVAYQKALDTMPELHLLRGSKIQEVRSKKGQDGLTSYQRAGKMLAGENNPAKRPEVREKISKGNLGKKRTQETIDQIKNIRSASIDGNKSINKLHSERMSGDGNPYYGSTWANDGVQELRIAQDEKMPTGYTRGRLETECPHCSKKGRGPNMTRYHFNNCKHKRNV